MRIASLVPSATEMLFALGLGDDVVAVTHECDHPDEALDLPRVTSPLLPPGLDPAEVDRAVRELSQQGSPLYEIDAERLHRLAPELIVTQGLCDVCAIPPDAVRQLAEEMDPPPEVVELAPTTLGEVLGDLRTLAQATDAKDRAVDVLRTTADRIDAVRLGVRDRRRVRVAAIEWLEPLYTSGHWIPQLIEYAGGDDIAGMSGERSERASWEELALMSPEVVVLMPCGYDAERALEEAEGYIDELASLGARRVVAVDASSYFSRPGPRLVDGLEIMAHVLHPERFFATPSPALEVHL